MLYYQNKRIFFSFLMACVAMASVLPNKLYAQNANTIESDSVQQDIKEEIAVIGLRVDSIVSELPGSVSVVNKEELQFIQPVHIQEALTLVPGVNYHRGNGQESLPSIRSAVLTGAGACGSVLILEENIPVRGTGSCNVNELFDTHFEQAGRIEVLRGSGTAFYGSNSLTGSINTVLSARAENRVSLEVGPHDYNRVKLAYNYLDSGKQIGSVYITHSNDGGYRDESGYDQTKFSWRHEMQWLNWDTQLGLTWTELDQETAGFITGLDSYRDRIISQQNLNPEAFRQTESLRAWIKSTNTISDKTQFDFTLYARETDMAFLQHFLPGDPLEENGQTGVGIQSGFRLKPAENIEWYVGFDLESSDFMLRQTQKNPTRGSLFLRTTIPTGTHYDYQVDSVQWAAFTHLNWQLNEKLKLLLGARYENIRYDYDNLSLDGRTRDDGVPCGFGGCRYSRPADSRNDFSHLSPKLELQYQASHHWLWHIAAASAYRAPQATELYRLQRAQTVADLDEVSAVNIETGVSWSHDDTNVHLVAYSLDQSNVIIRDSDFFNIDGQDTQSVGLELELEHRFAKRSEHHFWQINLAATLARHEYDSEQILSDINIRNNEIDTAPNFFSNALLTWNASRYVSSQLELQHVGSYYTEPTNQHSYPGHTLLHWSVNAVVRNWGMRLRLSNVTNTRYAERADFTSFTQERYFPGEPRSLYFELSYSF